jgi:hypothetical protein
MNYLPFVSWGVYGGATPTIKARYFASWGLMAALPSGLATVIPIFMAVYRRFWV